MTLVRVYEVRLLYLIYVKKWMSRANCHCFYHCTSAQKESDRHQLDEGSAQTYLFADASCFVFTKFST